VILADVGVTLAWGEPISALRAWLAQRQAAEDLEQLESEFDRRGTRFDADRLPILAGRLERQAEPGDAIGRIRVPAIGDSFERSRIVDPSRVGVVRDVGHDRLVLTACHPLYSAAQRYVVFARQVDVRPP
jgi:sortase (surface protein transpeptidase)